MTMRHTLSTKLAALALAAGGLAVPATQATAQELSPAPPSESAAPPSDGVTRPGEGAAPAGTAADQELAERVKETLVGDASMQGIQLMIRAVNGTVELTGVARDQTQAERAVALARTVPGVTEVLHDIQVA